MTKRLVMQLVAIAFLTTVVTSLTGMRAQSVARSPLTLMTSVASSPVLAARRQESGSSRKRGKRQLV